MARTSCFKYLLVVSVSVAFADFDIARAAETADTIFSGGQIVTMSESMPAAEAMAVADGEIVALGTLAQVEALRGPDTESVDLDGNTLMPGFIEPHSHPVGAAYFYDWIDVSGFNNPSGADVIAKLKKAAAEAEPGEWILGFGFDPILTRDMEAPTADFLDEISTENPIFIMLQAMHTVFVNHKALEVARVGRETPDPPGAMYVRDENGELTGMLVEAGAMLPFLMRMPPRSRAENLELLKAELRDYARAGVTTIGALGLLRVMPGAKALAEEVVRSADAPVRMVNYVAGNYYSDGVTSPGAGDDRFRDRGIKYWIDGSPYTGTMLLDEPYLDSELMQRGLGIEAGTSGHHVLPPQTLQDNVRKMHDAGWQVAIHAQGDRAIRDTVDIYEAVLKASPRADARHRMEHLAQASDADLERAARLGITPSFHINHIYYYGEALRDEILGPERAARLMPAGSALKYGHRFSFHADSPMYPPQPLTLVRTAVTRKTRSGAVIGPEQAIPVEEAIKGVTIHAAWQMFMEDEVGSLEVGKLADLVVLSDNPLTVDPDDLDTIEIVETYLAGRRVMVD